MMDITERNATHATFTIERIFKSSVARVFAAWADGEAKSQWFTGTSAWRQRERTFDFRVGGQDTLIGEWVEDGPASALKPSTVTEYVARYEDIVPNARIMFTYHMKMNGTPISVSLATVQFKPEGSGTRLIFTEQLTCIDGYEDCDARDREHGTALHLDRLDAYLEKA